MKASTPIAAQNGNSQHPPPQIDISKESECKKICTERFTFVIFYSIAAQYILLLIFLFLVNLQLLHPILWIRSTFSILFSFYTWLWTLPLIFTIAIFGIFNLKPHLKQKDFYGSRFVSFYKNFVQQLIILVLNALIGLLTAHLYIKYLKEDYRVFKLKTEELTILNDKHLFLLLSGLYMGVYYFFKRRSSDQLIVFPVVQQSKYLLLRQQFYSTIKASMLSSFMPVTKFILFFTITSKVLVYLTSTIFFLDIVEKSFLEGFSILMDARLILFVWILSSQILSNMELMHELTNILSTQPRVFPIEEKAELTLSEALSFNKFQLTQQLAAQDLFLLAERANDPRRRQFYSLSIPGGHPNNWKQLVAQSLKLIDNYSSELSKSIEKITNNKNNNICPPFFKMHPTLSNEVAEKLLVRQYNENYGIRSMAATPLDNTKDKPITPHQALIKNLNDKVDALKKRVHALPVVFYCFGEAENAKLCFLLVQQSQQVIWTSLGLAKIVAASLKEDNYGVVQNDIKRILKSLLRLKGILDKISSINLGDKKIDRNYFALKSAVKRAVYMIVTVFSRYFDDLNMDSEETRALQPFVFFKEL